MISAKIVVQVQYEGEPEYRSSGPQKCWETATVAERSFPYEHKNPYAERQATEAARQWAAGSIAQAFAALIDPDPRGSAG